MCYLLIYSPKFLFEGQFHRKFSLWPVTASKDKEMKYKNVEKIIIDCILVTYFFFM